MNIKLTKNNNILISHKLSKNQFYRITKNSKFESVTIMPKPQICSGFSSRTENNKDILLLDYDNVFFDVVIEDIDYLQNNYPLSQAYIFKTREKIIDKEKIGNYHIIFLSSYNPIEIMEMMKNTHIDKNYIDSPLRTKYRSYVLRLSKKNKRKKPKFIMIYLSKSAKIHKLNKINYPIISSAHKRLLSLFYPEIKHPSYLKEDNLIKFRLQKYETI